PEAIVDRAALSTIVTNNFYGDGHALQINSPGASQSVSVVRRGDLQGLLTATAAAGLPVELVDELDEAIRADREAGSPDGEPGPHVTGFLGRLALGTSRVSGKLALGAGGAVIASLVKGYLGIA
ncbi:MAG: hypothetical protein JWM93_3616, partial [Frankiales bacterium]|nr:hypothetical protein [Frankiales bacterium]